MVCLAEGWTQRVLYGRLQSLGYEVAFHDLPDSRHGLFSEAALQVAVDAINRPDSDGEMWKPRA